MAERRVVQIKASFGTERVMRIAPRLRYSHLCNNHLLRKSFVSTYSTAAPAPPIHHESVTPLAKLLLDSIKVRTIE